MKIIIVGAGALGLLYGARLARAGVDILMLTYSDNQAEQLNKEGIALIEGENLVSRIPVKAASLRSYIADAGQAQEKCDWIWLAVKQAHLDESMLAQLAVLVKQAKTSNAEETPIVALQNGIGHMDKLRAAMPQVPLYAAVTTEGALRVDSNTVHHTGSGSIMLGIWPRSDEITSNRQNLLLKTMEGAGIEAYLSNEVENRVFHKLLINAVINPLTAIFDVRNGDLPLDPQRKRLMETLHTESEQILLAAGMVSEGDSWQRVLQICEATARNESSMLRDVQASRVTEVDWINGGIVSLARKLGKPAPMNEAVLTMIKALHPNT
ncbi:2-dehydropantoate 2-reductase [Paenibacillus taihuensis]|uniref:2-dehydropantoate 2-reductase n=1 Tax=Paenibacillus taihuensis TaxID=1156355 RepID=A0A3D9SDS1_9BACL|nr:2-dehydropantoate 2-reductase [Paenibacillus taihuensis]REE93002.1 2-dehydropantoate 2-reductase [Paenibacillus taihuensis]